LLRLRRRPISIGRRFSRPQDPPHDDNRTRHGARRAFWPIQDRGRDRSEPLGFWRHARHRAGHWGPPKDRNEALATLRRAPELGINFIDTAWSYGPKVSEDLIRETLYPYDGLLIATKGGLTRGGPDDWGQDGRPEN
jgi:hypothetical protein